MELDNAGASLCTSPPSENVEQTTAVRSQVVDTERARENKGGSSIQLEIRAPMRLFIRPVVNLVAKVTGKRRYLKPQILSGRSQGLGADAASEDEWK